MLETRPAESLLPVPSPNLRRLLPGLPRGAVSEITGLRSSGRTALTHSLLAAATLGGEIAAIVDCNDAFEPASAARAGADLDKLLWVRCGGRLDYALKAADIILHGGGFGLVVLDLCEAPAAVLQRIPFSCWRRFQRAVAHTPTALLVAAGRPTAACAARRLEMGQRRALWQGREPFQLLAGIDVEAGLRKPHRPEPAVLRALAAGE